MSQSAVEQAHDALQRASDAEDPWLLSYADLVTNLLAFFVLIVSMATISFETIDALPGAFDSQQRDQPNLKTLTADVKTMIDAEGLRGQIIAQMDDQGLAIQLQDQIVFASGVATLSTDGRRLVEKIGRMLTRLPSRYLVLVEGHTDDVPIATAQFRSNWELSSARALEVRRELALDGVDDARISISAYAETRPLPPDPADPPDEVRRKNRRVVIRVY